MSIKSENTFESAIVESLVESGGYELGDSKRYNPETGLFDNEAIEFLQNSQPGEWDVICQRRGADAEKRVLDRLCSELDSRVERENFRFGRRRYR